MKKPHIRKVDGLWCVFARRDSAKPLAMYRSLAGAFAKAWRFRHNFAEFRLRRLP